MSTFWCAWEMCLSRLDFPVQKSETSNVPPVDFILSVAEWAFLCMQAIWPLISRMATFLELYQHPAVPQSWVLFSHEGPEEPPVSR